MKTEEAFARGEANKDEESRVFDWDKAAKIIKENSPEKAGAGWPKSALKILGLPESLHEQLNNEEEK